METTPQTLSLTVYNATTGESTTKTITSPGGAVTAAQLADGLQGVVTSEFAARLPAENQLGALVTAAGAQANLNSGNYTIWIPALALLPDGRSVYECMPNFNLRNGKRDFVVGVLHKPGVDTNGLPMYVWTDAIAELNRHMQSDSGIRYGSITFDANAANPDFTVGFANEVGSGEPAPGWREGPHAYMLGPKSVFPLAYGTPSNRDIAIEEIWEWLLGSDDICGTKGSREIIGKAAVTGNKEWGLNAVGVNLTRRNLTKGKP